MIWNRSLNSIFIKTLRLMTVANQSVRQSDLSGQKTQLDESSSSENLVESVDLLFVCRRFLFCRVDRRRLTFCLSVDVVSLCSLLSLVSSRLARRKRTVAFQFDCHLNKSSLLFAEPDQYLNSSSTPIELIFWMTLTAPISHFYWFVVRHDSRPDKNELTSSDSSHRARRLVRSIWFDLSSFESTSQ